MCKVKNENRAQMELYDNLINDIIGVNIEVKPEKDKCSSNDTSPTTAVPDKADPSKTSLPDKTKVPTSDSKPMLIGNLTWWTTADDLLAAIHSSGIIDVDAMKFFEVPRTGQFRGFVSLKLFSNCDVQRLLKVLPKKEVHGRTLDVRHFTIDNYRYFRMQSQTAMEKSKLNLTEGEEFDPEIAFDPLEEDNGAPIPVQIQQRISEPCPPPYPPPPPCPPPSLSLVVGINLHGSTPLPMQQKNLPPLKPRSSPPVPPPSPTSAVKIVPCPGSTLCPLNSPIPDMAAVTALLEMIPPILTAFPDLLFQYVTGVLHINGPGEITSANLNLPVPDLTSSPVPPVNIPAPVISGPGQSQMAQIADVDPMTVITPSTNSPGRETSIQENLQSNKELDGICSTHQNKDDDSEDYGTILRLVSFVKKSKAIAQAGTEDSNCSPDRSHWGAASFRDSNCSPDRSQRGKLSSRDSNCSPSLSHRGKLSSRDSNCSPSRSHRGKLSSSDSNCSPSRSHRGKLSSRDSNCSPSRSHRGKSSFRDSSYSLDRSHREESKRSGLREREYSRRRENGRYEERSGSLRDRSRSPSSCNSYYQRERMDYDQHRQQSDLKSLLDGLLYGQKPKL
ncbi:cleavage and polyadenylation specificity factor subunit 6-like isoform X2 [Scyliorhinus canicula]|uniref:cleavage and polyadenylation specificity factor subunit 6-like isoform X2 n=1 Tax=Scyliorhinus canicula TaxID=7830 RepID=UPI0018F6039A|nr:cleavage and polyadenylation specificity factor subunit 6-like isoform X2 [Scyliorhinus canicula]